MADTDAIIHIFVGGNVVLNIFTVVSAFFCFCDILIRRNMKFCNYRILVDFKKLFVKGT